MLHGQLLCWLNRSQPSWKQKKKKKYFHINLCVFVVMGIYFQALVKGCQFLQVKLFGCCKYAAAPPPASSPPAVQIQISYLVGCGADAVRERADAFGFSFLLQITRFIRNTASWDCTGCVHCQKRCLVYPYSQDFGVNSPQQPRGDCD